MPEDQIHGARVISNQLLDSSLTFSIEHALDHRPRRMKSPGSFGPALGLGNEGYMNLSGKVAPLNWRWRLRSVADLRRHSDRLRLLTAIHG